MNTLEEGTALEFDFGKLVKIGQTQVAIPSRAVFMLFGERAYFAHRVANRWSDNFWRQRKLVERSAAGKPVVCVAGRFVGKAPQIGPARQSISCAAQ